MSPTAPCRFFALGRYEIAYKSCSKGKSCPFAHDAQEPLVCPFYLNGTCKFGNKCALVHSKPKKLKNISTKIELSSLQSCANTSNVKKKDMVFIDVPTYSESTNKSTYVEPDTIKSNGETIPNLSSLCPFSASCKFGLNCKYLHAKQCPKCLQYCLHPEESQLVHDEHIKSCVGIEEVVKMSSFECAVCMENPKLFGLLDCNHAVCLSCIRNWRGNEHMETAKSCPICRCVTHFITPSAVWPRDAKDKDKIVAAYKSKLSKIDCKYYAFGEGSCPFSTSCFYRHADRNGKITEVKLRHLLSADERADIYREVKLSDFLE